jgi:hypothetical protein
VPRPSSPLSAKASTRCPYLRLIPASSSSKRSRRRRITPPRTGARPPTQAAAHEDTSSDTSSAPCFRKDKLCAGRVRLGHMTNSLFTLQSTPRPAHPDSVSHASPNVAPAAPARPAGGGAANGGGANGGGERIRTDDLLLAKQALSQLSYTPLPENSNQGSVIRSSDHCLLMTDLWQWWAREDLNLRPHAYQARALTS